MSVDLKQLLTWREQIVRDRMAWAAGRTTNQTQLDGYKAGLEQGMAEILNTLNLHGHLTTK